MHQHTSLRSWSRRLAAFLPAAVALASQAQSPAAPSQQPAPTSLAYRSAFAGYKTLADPTVVRPWRESNDTVGRVGGWREYAKETREPAPASTLPVAPAATASQPKAAPDPHRHHGGRP